MSLFLKWWAKWQSRKGKTNHIGSVMASGSKDGGSKIKSSHSKPNDNPYLNAKVVWNDRVAQVISERQMWQLVGLFALALTLSSIAGVIYMGMQPKYVPYVIEVDSLGEAVAINKVYPAAPIDERVLKAVVANFISNSRAVTLDGTLQTDFIERVFAVIAPKSAAFTKMAKYYRADPPHRKAQDELVTTEIESVIRRANKSWQVDWVELTTNREGGLIDEKKWRALITIDVSPPDSVLSESHLKANPLGIYVTDFDWSKQGY